MPSDTQPPAAGEAAHVKDGLILPLRTHVRVHINDSIVVDACNEHFVITGLDHKEKAEQIVRACNSHAQLTAENAALREGLRLAAKEIWMRTTDDNPTLRHLRALLSGQPAKDPVKAQLVAEIKALNEYGARRFGDEWWPGQDPEFIAALSAAKEPTP